jgi:hypothetical protein
MSFRRLVRQGNERPNPDIVTLVSSGYHFLGALALKDSDMLENAYASLFKNGIIYITFFISREKGACV